MDWFVRSKGAPPQPNTPEDRSQNVAQRAARQSADGLEVSLARPRLSSFQRQTDGNFTAANNVSTRRAERGKRPDGDSGNDPARDGVSARACGRAAQADRRAADHDRAAADRAVDGRARAARGRTRAGKDADDQNAGRDY